MCSTGNIRGARTIFTMRPSYSSLAHYMYVSVSCVHRVHVVTPFSHMLYSSVSAGLSTCPLLFFVFISFSFGVFAMPGICFQWFPFLCITFLRVYLQLFLLCMFSNVYCDYNRISSETLSKGWENQPACDPISVKTDLYQRDASAPGSVKPVFFRHECKEDLFISTLPNGHFGYTENGKQSMAREGG